MDNTGICRLKGWIAVYLIGVSILVVPLYIRDGYLNLIQEKAAVYLHLSVPALILAGILSVISAVLRKERMRAGLAVGLLFLTAAWTLVSSLLSPDRRASFFGTIGWSMGSLTLCTLICSTICIAAWFPSGRGVRVDGSLGMVRVGKRTVKADKKVAVGSDTGIPGFPVYFSVLFAAVHIVIFLFAILQAAGQDLFGFLSVIDTHYYYSYLSTIGQKNCFSGYLCLLLPLFWGLFMQSGNTVSVWIYGLLSTLGLFCAAIADSDSLYAGFGFCLLFLIPFALQKRQRAVRAAFLLLIFGGCLFMAGSLPPFMDRVSHMEDFSAFMVSFPGAGIVLLAGVLLLLFSEKRMDDRDSKASRRFLCAAEAFVLAAIAAGVIRAAFSFSDSWGTNRGLIWRIGWEQFLKAPLIQKLVGIGPEMLAVLYAELRVSPGINVLSAHCEPLHVLLTQGVIGLVLYLVLWGYILYLWIKNDVFRKGRNAVWFFPLAAYWGQSLFCPLYPVTAAFFSAVSGLCLHFAQGPAADKQP